MTQTTKRFLSQEEEYFVLSRGMGVGYDGDDCFPQLSHIVYRLDKGLFSLCRSSSLWFGSNGGGTQDEPITCTQCLKSLQEIMESKSSVRISFVSEMDDLMQKATESYRPDIYNLLTEIKKSWVVGERLNPSALAQIMAASLSAKSVRTLDVLRDVTDLDWVEKG